MSCGTTEMSNATHHAARYCWLSVFGITLALLCWSTFGSDQATLRLPGLKWFSDSASSQGGGHYINASDNDATILSASAVPNVSRRWISETQPAQPGRAYVFSAYVKSALVRARGRLELVFLDARGVELLQRMSATIFSRHDWARFEVSSIAPPAATRVLGRLVAVGDQAGSAGEVLFSKPIIQPGIESSLQFPSDLNVLSPGKETAASLVVLGGQPGASVDVRWVIQDFSGNPVHATTGSSQVEVGREIRLPIPSLNSGYYVLVVSVTGSGIATNTRRLSFAVLPPAPVVSPLLTARIGLDAGMSWSYAVDKARLAKAVQLARLAGVGILRDRLSWSKTEPQPGQITWGDYRVAATEQSRAGMEVAQVFHDAPAWSHGGDSHNLNRIPPRDPFVMYRYAKRLATDLGKEIRFLEVWNEENSDFFLGRPEDYAALLKAAYLGAKDGSPSLGVLLGAAAGSHPMGFFDRMFENGAGAYFDIFSQHYYGAPEDLFSLIPSRVEGVLQKYGQANKPIWITEMGKAARPAVDGSYEDVERQQTFYLVKAYASAFANGVDRFFYFYLKEFLEDDSSLWGILRDDLSPKPAYVALSNLTRAIGGADCVGWKTVSGGYVVYFRRPDKELVAIAWSGQRPVLSVQADGPVVDVVGRLLETRPRNGKLDVVLNDSPVFVRALNESVLLDVGVHKVGLAHRWSPVPDLSMDAKRIWLQLEVNPDAARPSAVDQIMLEKAGGAIIRPDAPFQVAAWVNNYSDNPVKVLVKCKPDSTLALRGVAEAEMSVGPWQRVRHDFILSVRAPASSQTSGIEIEMTTPVRSEVNRVYVQILPSDIRATMRHPIVEVGNDQLWAPSSSKNVSVALATDPTVSHDGKKALRVKSHVNEIGESWVFPKLTIPRNVKLSTFRGIEFWSYAAPNTFDRVSNLVVQLVEEGGGIWTVNTPRSITAAGWQRHVAVFARASPAPWKPDPDNKLDLSKVHQIMVGWGGHYGRQGETKVFWLSPVSAVDW